MTEGSRRSGPPPLLHYRAWRGTFAHPLATVWPIARTGLTLVFRRRLFWVLYALGLMLFLMFFFGQYLMAWAATQLGEEDVRVGGFGRANPRNLVNLLSNLLRLNGSAETFSNFFWYQGYILMVVLALGGSVLVGNDMRFGTLPYYLAKPLGTRHYLLGKGLAAAVLVNLLTTVPALLLFVQYSFLSEEPYLWPPSTAWTELRQNPGLGSLAGVLTLPRFDLLLGILGYGVIVTTTNTLVLLATSTWLRRTVPLVMAWTTLYVLCRMLAGTLVDVLHLGERWRLIDLWNSTWLVGSVCLGLDPGKLRPQPQPEWYEAAAVLGGVWLACLIYLSQRVRGVEVIR